MTTDNPPAPAVPAVSVLMDVSGKGPFLDDALASLAAQSFDRFEIVLVAHGIDAATEARLAAWEQREPRLRVLRHPRMSLSRAHQLAADTAIAPLLARLDADDVALPHRLEHQAAMFASDPKLDFAGGAVEIIAADGQPLSVLHNPTSHAAIVAALPHCSPLVHSTLMVRGEVFRRAGGYRRGLNISEDYDLYCRLAAIGRGGNLGEPICGYRVHGYSMTSRNALRMAIANEAVRAALSARASGVGEPFVSGVPSLRRAAAITERSRRQLVEAVYATARQSRFSRRLLTAWMPLRAQVWMRDAALALGLRPVYAGLFRLGQRLALLRQGAGRPRTRPQRPGHP